MKPFDLQLAMKGHPVQTVDGRPVKLIFFDMNNELGKPVVGIVPNGGLTGTSDFLETWTINGTVYNLNLTPSDPLDLVMVPDKKKGWINIYKDRSNDAAPAHTGSYIHKSKESALKGAAGRDGTYITTIEIEWEED
ncbi:MAG: hypothetical protein HUJ56_01855 [Erysipelotrichaceae bacterium]|nr:hypothetical protein [Erysipelotrichaceae bacterium]